MHLLLDLLVLWIAALMGCSVLLAGLIVGNMIQITKERKRNGK